MADVRDPLPVATEGEADGKVDIKICDADTPSQKVSVSDGNLHAVTVGEGSVGNVIQSTVGVVTCSRGTDPDRERMSTHPTTVNNVVENSTNLDVAIHHSNGDSITVAKPIPVIIVDDTSKSEEYKHLVTAAPLAKNASEDILHTNGASNLFVSRLSASASSAFKVVFSRETAADVWEVLATRFASVANPNIDVHFDNPVLVAPTRKLKAAVTNTDGGTKDIYVDYEGQLQAV